MRGSDIQVLEKRSKLDDKDWQMYPLEEERTEVEECLNNLSSKDLERMYVRNAKLRGKYMKHEDDYVE